MPSIGRFNHIVLSLRDPESMDHDDWTEELLWELVQQGYEAFSGKDLTVVLDGYEQQWTPVRQNRVLRAFSTLRCKSLQFQGAIEGADQLIAEVVQTATGSTPADHLFPIYVELKEEGHRYCPYSDSKSKLRYHLRLMLNAVHACSRVAFDEQQELVMHYLNWHRKRKSVASTTEAERLEGETLQLIGEDWKSWGRDRPEEKPKYRTGICSKP
ncbi:hypothetical protein OHC33_000983 [Knufia fluminis]|uniref:Uncharacterized protein n=1 Tax=Knufia fluminis TaxID=191047 RepID=A0AAN8EKD4_9EURO|nr:hypothetical protein OHC33_000983 [Knufia fluminis]